MIYRRLVPTVIVLPILLFGGCTGEAGAPPEPVASAPLNATLAPQASASTATVKTDATQEPWLAMRIAHVDKDGKVSISDSTGTFQPLPNASGPMWWTPDGAALIGRTRDTVIRCPIAPTSSCQELFSSPNLWRLSASPEGRWFLAAPGNGDSSSIIDIESGERRTIPTREGAWLGSNRIVYFPYPSKQMHVWDVRGGAATPLGAPIDAESIQELVPSPDARFIAVVTRRPEKREDGSIASFYGVALQDTRSGAWITRFEATKRAAAPLAGTHLDPPVWSPDGKRMVVVDDGHVTVIEESKRWAPRALPQTVHGALGWLDATRIAYLTIDHSDNTQVAKYGHGVIQLFVDVGVLDVDTGARSKLTSGGAFSGGVVSPARARAH